MLLEFEEAPGDQLSLSVRTGRSGIALRICVAGRITRQEESKLATTKRGGCAPVSWLLLHGSDHSIWGRRINGDLSDSAAARYALRAPGSTTDMAGRRLWKEARLDPATDMTNVRVGALPSQIAAMKQGSIDVFLASAPGRQFAEAQNIGTAVVQFGDVPSRADEPFDGILMRRYYLDANSDIAVVPENSIRPESRGEAESGHHQTRCSLSST